MKRLLFTLMLLTPALARASESTSEEDKQVTPEEFKLAMADAEAEYTATLSKRAEQQQTALQVPSHAPIEEPIKDFETKKTSTMEELAAQVDTLKNRVIVERTSLLATQSPRKVKVQGGKTIFNYRDDALYEITASVDHVTDIALKPGESLTTAPSAGDTVRWSLSVMKSGVGSRAQTHLVVKPLDENIETNLIITTDENVYHLKLKSGDFHMPAVAWNYPSDSNLSIQQALKKEQTQEATIKPDMLRFDYEIEGKDYDWKPVRVFDDGQKTFIQMPKNLRVTEAPVLFLLDDDAEPLIVNYRVKGDLYIVDRLLEQAELRVGTSKKVSISRDDGKNFFERLFS
jgi:P-type conjugative transfer protein TrbG